MRWLQEAAAGMEWILLGHDRMQASGTHRFVIGAREHVAAGVDKGAHGAGVASQRLQALHCVHVPHLHRPVIAATEQPIVRHCQSAHRIAVTCPTPIAIAHQPFPKHR